MSHARIEIPLSGLRARAQSSVSMAAQMLRSTDHRSTHVIRCYTICPPNYAIFHLLEGGSLLQHAAGAPEIFYEVEI